MTGGRFSALYAVGKPSMKSSHTSYEDEDSEGEAVEHVSHDRRLDARERDELGK